MNRLGANTLTIVSGSLLPATAVGTAVLPFVGQPFLAVAAGAASLALGGGAWKAKQFHDERKVYTDLIKRFDADVEAERKADQDWHDQRIRDWLDAENEYVNEWLAAETHWHRAQANKRTAERRREDAERTGGDRAPLRIKRAERAWEKRVLDGIEADKRRMAAEFDEDEEPEVPAKTGPWDSWQGVEHALAVEAREKALAETAGPYAVTREFGTRKDSPFLTTQAHRLVEKRAKDLAELQRQLIRKSMASTIAMTAPLETQQIETWGAIEPLRVDNI
ncbi:membrane protein [Rhodococcus phage GuyFagieri]|nr:membrane protein [Rhodococcus phage GuyFagieri]